MTETEWLACTDPKSMLVFLEEGRASERKLRLFACACVRRIWGQLKDPRSQRAVEVAERYADSQCELEEMGEACESAWDVIHDLEQTDGDDWPEQVEYAAADAAAQASCIGDADCPYLCRAVDTTRSVTDLARYAMLAAGPDSDAPAAEKAEQRIHASLLHDIFNPFRPVRLSRAWLAWEGGTAPKIAQGIYADHAYERLPILADALEEAGCTNTDILSHCRSAGPHVRGCWVIDLLLGKQ
jgi:hypothetical protein